MERFGDCVAVFVVTKFSFLRGWSGLCMFWTGLRTRWNLRALRILGAAWKDGACAICSVEELHNCLEEKCTADLHEGAFELFLRRYEM